MRAIAISLHLELDPTKRSFRGEARYRLSVDKACRQIELHAHSLVVSHVRAYLADETTAGSVEYHPECETLLLKFDRLIRPGEIEFGLRFRGRVRDDLRGLYRSTDRKAPWLASQLCPTDARRLFPCLDEPGTKARYTISVTAPADQTVLSNAPIARRSKIGSDGRRKTEFQETPPLSAYLIAVAVGPFEASAAARCGGTPVRVFTLPGRQPLAKFARKAAVESLTRLERWFGMPHPYAKLDLLALPDFAFGAMENAGAVFFRDSVLLLDEKQASAEDTMRAAETIAHELSHMWFGNLVTMAWWNDLWLNESFATWMAYEIVEQWRPEWRIWLEFIQRRESALEVDSLRSSHPIAPPVRTAEEAHENFDAITYTKGASVLRMLERYIGAPAFKKGVRRYIRRHREGAAAASDLWSALAEVTGLDIERIVAPWTLQTGFPIVRAEHPVAAADKPLIALRQERFLTLPVRTRAGQKRRGSEPRWSIPWLGRVGDGRTSREIRHVLESRQDRVAFDRPKTAWLYANASEAGFFRIDHGAAGFERLLDAAARLSELERIGWLGHQWALVRSGRAPISTILDLVTRLAGEVDPDVLAAVDRVLSHLLRELAPASGSATEERLRHWIEIRFEEQYAELGIEGPAREELGIRRRRARILSILGERAQSSRVREACTARAEEHLFSGRALPRGAGDEILRIAAAGQNPAVQEALIEAIGQAPTPQDRRRNLFALASFERDRGLRRTLRATLDVKLAPAVDRATLLMLLLSSPVSAPKTWNHLQRVWERLEREMPPILLARIVGCLSTALPPSEAPRIARFFHDHPLAAGSRVLDQVAEELKIARALERHAAKDLARELLSRKSPRDSPSVIAMN